MITYFYIVLVLCMVASITISTFAFLKRMRELDENHAMALEQIDLKFMGNFEILGHRVRFFVPDNNGETRLYEQIVCRPVVRSDRELNPAQCHSRTYKLTKKQLFQLEMAGVICTYDKELAYKWARKLNLTLPDNAEKLFGPIAQLVRAENS